MKDSLENDHAVRLAEAFQRNLQGRLSAIPSKQMHKATEAILSAAVNSYVEVNKGKNGIAVSADKKTEYIRENHPEIAIAEAPKPALDLCITGGEKPMPLETELGSAKLVKNDYNKILNVEGGADRYIVTRTKSSKHLGLMLEEVRSDSTTIHGTITHTEIYLPNNKMINESDVRTRTFRNGDLIFASTSVSD